MAIDDESSFSSEKFSGTARLFPLPNLVLFPHVMQPFHIFELDFCKLSVQPQLGEDVLRFFGIIGDLNDGPLEGCAQGLGVHCAAGLADGRQPLASPLLGTALPEFDHQEAVRQHHQVHVPCLALATAQLTVSHAQLLFAVPMEGLGACPATTITAHNARCFPGRPIGNQDLRGAGIATILPQDQNPHGMIYIRHPYGAGEVPLPHIATAKFFTVFARNRCGKILRFTFPAFEPQFAIELQVTDIPSRPTGLILLAVDVIQVLGAGKIAIKREYSGNLPFAHPVDQVAKQDAVILEGFIGGFALLSFLEAAEVQWIMLATAAHVIGEQIIVSNLVTFFGMIPEPPDILNELPVVIDQHIVDSNHPLVVITCARIALQQLQAAFIQLVGIPIDFGQEAVQTRLVGSVHEFVGDAVDSFVAGDHQAGEIFGEVFALRCAAEKVGELFDRSFDDLGKRDDPCHDEISVSSREPTSTKATKTGFFQTNYVHAQHLPLPPMLAIPHLVLAS